MSVLDVENLSVRYLTEDNASDIINNISLKVEEGEIVGLVGESGSGKSTAMRAVMGLLGENASVSSDRITICGQTPVPGQNVAMIFQDSLSCLNPSVKIGRQLKETVQIRRKCGRKEASARSKELLDLVGIRNPSLRMRQYPFELSGGMRQRVVLAIALACEPELIIADEPTTALDAVVQAQIILLLKRVVKETKTSLLLVSHDMGVIAAMCSRVYVMHQGKIVENGTAEDIFYAPVQEYTRRLLKDAQGGRPKRTREKKEAGQENLIFRMEHVTKNFNANEGVRDLSMEIRESEVFALVGESGSGKTTTARILAGIQMEDEGTLYYRGKVLDRRRRMDSLGGRVQMVFQDPYTALNPCLTVRQMLEEALGTTAGGNAQKIEDILNLTGLSQEDADRYPRDFSGGQRQRIGIARALIVEPELLVCDEALSSLDASARERILELLLRIQKRIGFACLFISHDIHVVKRISDRAGVMYGGRIVETGETKKICSDPWHPYTKQLMEAVPEADPIRSAKIKAVPETDRGNVAASGCPFAGRCGYVMECCTEEVPESYRFGDREVSCFLYSEKHSGRRGKGYKMSSQI